MEELTALCCLWVSGLGTKSDYTEKLDELFLQDPENDLLLELEGLTGDKRGTLARFYINEENADKFGKILIGGVEKYYINNVSDKPEESEPFTKLTYKLWSGLSAVLPFDIANSDPILIFSYADEALERGGRDRLSSFIKRRLIIINSRHTADQ